MGQERLKVLFFSQRFLYPLDTGGKIRTGKLLENVKDSLDITLISNMERPKEDQYFEQVRSVCSAFHPVPWKEIRKYSLRFYLRVFLRSFSPYPVTVINDYSRDLEAKILQVLEQDRFDLLICDFLQPTLNFRKIVGYPMLLFQHNVESVIVRRHLETAQSFPLKLFWWFQVRKMERYEKRTCKKFDGVIAVSEVDKRIFSSEFAIPNVSTIPTGVDTKYYTPSNNSVQENSLVFVGAMDWFPNEDAITFFTREVWPKLVTRIPNISLTVVGRNPSDALLRTLRKYPEIKAVGRVEDIRPFVHRNALYVVPLRIGGGTRIKIYEAMAMGKAVVSTHIGAEGLPVKSGENIMLVETADEFAQAVVHLLGDHQARERLERNARSFVVQNCSWENAARLFTDICQQTVQAWRGKSVPFPSGENVITV